MSVPAGFSINTNGDINLSSKQNVNITGAPGVGSININYKTTNFNNGVNFNDDTTFTRPPLFNNSLDKLHSMTGLTQGDTIVYSGS